MNPDGSNQVRLTNDSAADYQPAWSPDGKRIAFRSNARLWIMNADGSGRTPLVDLGLDIGGPSWSPNGNQIAFNMELTHNGPSEIFIIDVNGSNLLQLTSSGSERDPSWSPDGNRLAFASGRGGQGSDIYVIDANGANETRVTFTPGDDDEPSWSPDGMKIAFKSFRDGNAEIYIMNFDGTDQVRLTNNPAHDDRPSWSPDNAKIVFQSNRDGNHEIYAMNRDGGGQARVTNNPDVDHFPVWSPFLSKIAFVRGDGSGAEIYIMNPDGTNQVRLTNNGSADYQPAWSADGKKIAFRSDRPVWVMNADGSSPKQLVSFESGGPSWSPDGTKVAFDAGQVYVVNTDGTNIVQVTTSAGPNLDPSWSADGTQLAFVSGRAGNSGDIYIINTNGSNERRLTFTPSPGADEPSWSPDGAQVAFKSFRDGNAEIYLINTDGSNEIRLTNNSAHDDRPSWSPDGTRIVFQSNRDGNHEIYTMNRDGTDQRRITNNPDVDHYPAWSPFLGARLNTSVGTNVTVSPDANTILAFSDVVSAGYTSVTTSANGPTTPSGFSLGEPATYYEVTTTVTFSGPVTTCFAYDPARYSDVNSLLLLHYEDGQWFDVTTSNNTATHVICGQVGSFSPFAVAEPLISVGVDIKPGSYPNTINLGSNGVVPVAILSSATFDARTVNPSTVTLASAPVKLTGKGTPMFSIQDVNGDGRLDLVVQVSTSAFQLTVSDTVAVLKGKTNGGVSIKGTDTIRVVP